MSKFIYAFGMASRKELEGLGYEMIYEDGDRDIYVFLNSEALSFSAQNGKFAMSDTLTF